MALETQAASRTQQGAEKLGPHWHDDSEPHITATERDWVELVVETETR
jgi:hypothetical protein